MEEFGRGDVIFIDVEAEVASPGGELGHDLSNPRRIR
jgi:hypothetical protein